MEFNSVDPETYEKLLDFPAGAVPVNHYQLLKIAEFSNDTQAIRDSYRALNQMVRSRASGEYLVPAQVVLNELARGMMTLTDPLSKAQYDQELKR